MNSGFNSLALYPPRTDPWFWVVKPNHKAHFYSAVYLFWIFFFFWGGFTYFIQGYPYINREGVIHLMYYPVLPFVLYSLFVYCTAFSNCLKVGPVLEMNLSLLCQRVGTWNEPEFTVPKVLYLKGIWVYSAKGPVLEMNLSLQYQKSGIWNEPEFTVPKVRYLKWTWVYSAKGLVLERNLSLQCQKGRAETV